MKTLSVLLLVLLLTFYVWQPLTQLSLRGDGYVYLIDSSHALYWKKLSNFLSFDWSAMAFGKLLAQIFGVKMSLYFWTEIIFLLATVSLFFWAVLVISKNRLVAFSASLILAVNFFGNFDIYAGGIYPWFQERIPLMLFLIPSLAFLHLYLEKQKSKYYVWSVGLFFIGVGMAHWGVLFTAPYFFYPVFWQFFKKGNKKLLLNALLKGLVYCGISGLFISLQKLVASDVGPTWSFLEYLTRPQTFEYPQKIIMQLVYWTSYLPIFEGGRMKFNFVEASKSLIYTPHVLVAYIVAGIIIYKNLVKQRALLATIIFSTLSIFYLNAYFGQYHIDSQPGTNRYLYLPTYLLAIFWSFFLWAVFWQKRSILIFGGFAFLAPYFFLSNWLIQTGFHFILERHDVTNKIWSYIINQRGDLPPNTLVVIPKFHTGFYEATFLNDQLGNGEVMYIDDSGDWTTKALQAGKIIRLDFDEDCNCVVEYEIDKENLPKNEQDK